MQNTVADALSVMLLKHKDMAGQAGDISGGIARSADIHLPRMTDSLPHRAPHFTLTPKPVIVA